MRLLCWLYGHKWLWTVATEHDAQDFDDDFCCWYRGLWHERVCTRCGKEEAVYQKTIYSWCVSDPDFCEKYDFKPTEHYRMEETWRSSTC